METNFLPEIVYQKLPEFLQELTRPFSERERDVVLLSPLGVLSAALPSIEEIKMFKLCQKAIIDDNKSNDARLFSMDVVAKSFEEAVEKEDIEIMLKDLGFLNERGQVKTHYVKKGYFITRVTDTFIIRITDAFIDEEKVSTIETLVSFKGIALIHKLYKSRRK